MNKIDKFFYSSKKHEKAKRKHYHKRAYQRASISNQHNADSFANNAFYRGHYPQYYLEKYNKTNNPLYEDFYLFLLNKQKQGKRVKVYKQWIFVFNSTNNKPTTMYEVPNKYLDLIELVTIDTKITFKLFRKDPYIIKTTKSQSTFQHIKRYFAQLNLADGPFFVNKDGTIEKDYCVVGMWRVEKI